LATKLSYQKINTFPPRRTLIRCNQVYVKLLEKLAR
jgi:hypothetical protein